MSRGATAYRTRGQSLALPRGTLANPSIRLGGERLGLYRDQPGRLGIGVNKFRAFDVSEFRTVARSNSEVVPTVSPFAFDRAVPTSANGHETAIDAHETGVLRGRLALYRQAVGKFGWKLYGSTDGALTSDLTLSGDGHLTARGDLIATRDVVANRDLAVTRDVTVNGKETVVGEVRAGSLYVTGATTFSGPITLTGGATLPTGSITSTSIQDRTIVGGDIAVNTITTTEIQDGTILGGDINPATGITVAGLASTGNLQVNGQMNGGVTTSGTLQANVMNVGSGINTGSLNATGNIVTPATVQGGFLQSTGGGSFATNVAIGGALSLTRASGTALYTNPGVGINIGGAIAAGGDCNVGGTVWGAGLNVSGPGVFGGVILANAGINSAGITGTSLGIGGPAGVQTLHISNTTVYPGGSSATAAAFFYLTVNNVGYKVPLFN